MVINIIICVVSVVLMLRGAFLILKMGLLWMLHCRIIKSYDRKTHGKVVDIEVIKMVKATNEHATVFDASELDVIQAGLTRLYGDPQYKLTENNSQYNRIGVQWISNSKEANCFIDFYGTFVGYKLQFSLCEHSEDF